MERTIKIPLPDIKRVGTDPLTEWEVRYTVEWQDTSFAHAFGYEHQGHYEVTQWELTISKFTTGWKCLTIDCMEVPEPLYDVIDKLVEKHLEENQPEEN